MMFTVNEHTNLKAKNGKYGDMQVVHSLNVKSMLKMSKTSSNWECMAREHLMFSDYVTAGDEMS